MHSIEHLHEHRFDVTTKYFQQINDLDCKYNTFIQSMLQQRKCIKQKLKQRYENVLKLIDDQIQSLTHIGTDVNTKMNANSIDVAIKSEDDTAKVKIDGEFNTNIDFEFDINQPGDALSDSIPNRCTSQTQSINNTFINENMQPTEIIKPCDSNSNAIAMPNDRCNDDDDDDDDATRCSMKPINANMNVNVNNGIDCNANLHVDSNDKSTNNCNTKTTCTMANSSCNSNLSKKNITKIKKHKISKAKNKIKITQSIRENGVKKYKCAYLNCNKIFLHNNTCYSHYIRQHTTRFQCQTCNSCFPVLSQLKRHQRSHTGEKPYKCHYCGRAFCTKGQCTRHEKIHTGERPHQCRNVTCGKRFITTTERNKHELIHDRK